MELNPKILIFDFEVTKHDWGVTFKYFNEDKKVEIHNNKDALVAFLKAESASFFVGFNNKNYDDWIIAAILCNRDPYEISRQIINEGKKGWQLGLRRPSLATIDLKQDNINNQTLSLKEAEANMGMSIEESPIDFFIGRPLTQEELKELFEYCYKDVLGTEELFKRRLGWINTKSTLIKLMNLGKRELGDTNAQLAAKVLTDRKVKKEQKYNFVKPSKLDLGKYENILNLFTNGIPNNFALDYKLGNLECKLGLGGLHGAIPKYKSDGSAMYAFIDVEMFYPSIMIEEQLFSEAIKDDRKATFIDVYEKRRLAKMNGDKDKSNAYKQLLVSTYGAMDNQYNNLYDPDIRRNIAVTGQLYLIDLIDKIEEYCEIIQVNTDGLLVKVNYATALQQQVLIWERRTGFRMEWDYVEKVWQKDVNNYYVKLLDGKVKVKGGYLKQASDDWDVYSRNNMRVIDLALKEYFENGTSVETFIRSHNIINDFQIVVKDKNKMVEASNTGLIATHQKVNRLFATNNYLRGAIYSNNNNVLTKAQNTPNNVYVYNGDMNSININEVNLDYNFYINIAKSRLLDFGALNIN